MIAYILQVSLCLAIFYVFYHFALRKETLFTANRGYLLITLCLSFLLPLVRITIMAFHSESLVIQTPVYIGNYVQQFEDIAVSPVAESFSWWTIIRLVYWAGVIIILSRLLLAFKAIIDLKSKTTSIIIGDQQCITSAKIRTPFSFFNSIFIPTDHHFTEKELKEVICHEQAHVSGRHSWDILLSEVAMAFLWFNPFVYLFKKSLKEIHEYVADAAVIKNDSWEPYAKFLVSQQYTGIQSPLVHQLIYSQLKNRLIMMTQKPSSWIAKWKYTGALPLLLLALLVFSFRPKESDATMSTDTFHAMGMDGNTEQPIFPGCEKLNLMEIEDCSKKKLYEYVADHLKYPDELKEAKIEGKVYVKFVITSKGLVADAKVTRSLHPAADNAALDVVNSMNENVGKWTPGSKEGIPVNMDMVLPFSFVLDSNDPGPPPAKLEQGDQTEPYSYVDKMPTFPDGQEVMYLFIMNNLKYPELAKQKKVSGTVYIQFVVSKDGEIKDAIVKRGIGSGCDEEALRVVNSMPKWNPGIHKGNFVPVIFTLPVKFVLQ